MPGFNLSTHSNNGNFVLQQLSNINFQSSNLQNTLSAFSMAGAEKLQIQKVLNHTGGNKTEAARLLQIGVATLYRKIDEYNL